MHSEELKAMREQANVTQGQMADMLGMSKRTYERHEQRASDVPGPLALAVKHLLECKPEKK